MKIRQIIVTGLAGSGLFAVLLSLAGCYLAAVHPLASPEQRSFDAALIGTWAGGSDTLHITGDAVDNLELTVVEGAGITADSPRRGTLETLVTVIAGRHFLDVLPAEIKSSPLSVLEQTLMVPMHGVIRYRVAGDSLILQYLNYREFDRKGRGGKAFGLKLERVAADGPLLITSSTEQLRRFLARHGGDEALFEEPTVYMRQK